MATVVQDSSMLSKYGVYRITDCIHNFKIRVRLEKGSSDDIDSIQTAESASDKRSAAEELELRELFRFNRIKSCAEIDEYVFSWQEKIFSLREEEHYSSINEDSASELEKKYHHQVEEMRKRGRPTKRLFSYVDVDTPSLEGQTATLQKDKRTVIRNDINVLRRRKNGPRATLKRKTSKNHLFPKVVNYNPSEIECKEEHSLVSPIQVMYIMADVGDQIENQESEDNQEVTLCTITADANCGLIVKPDFNYGQQPYRFETGNLGREVYHYSLEHASVSIDPEAKERETKIFQDFNLRRCTLLTNEIGFEFHEPPKGILYLHIFGEIESVEDFEHNSLHVYLFVDLPKDWTVEGEEPLYKVTQTSITKCTGNSDVAHFSFPFEYHISCPVKSLWEETTENLPRWPEICFQVVSRDSWNRYRTEGYGHIPISSRPGCGHFRVKTWRPIVMTLGSRLQQFFIGGSPELEDITLAGNIPIVQGKLISKYGMRTESSGSISVRLQTVQHCPEFASFNSQDKLERLADRLRSSWTLEASVETVLEAFHRARHRMMVARGYKGLSE